MLNTKKLLTKILTQLKDLKVETVVKEGVTIYRLGKLRIVRLDSPSSWCATLWGTDTPSIDAEFVGKVYNGTSYVDCLVKVNRYGEVRITDMFSGTIANAQYSYARPRWLTYFVD